MILDENGKTVADIPGQQRNHAVAIVPEANRGFITDGKDGSVVIFDLKSNEVLGKVKADPVEGLDFQEWIKYDIEYVENQSWRLDLAIIRETLATLVRGITRS